MRRSIGDFEVLVKNGEDGYLIASVPSLPGCQTQAKSREVLI